MDASNSSTDVLFILLGAIMVLAMHGGFAFLEVGTVRKKNQVNALVKILCDFFCVPCLRCVKLCILTQKTPLLP